jgi:hypothetical protein
VCTFCNQLSNLSLVQQSIEFPRHFIVAMKCPLFHPLDQSPLEIFLGLLNSNIKCESCVLCNPCSSAKSYQWYCITNSKQNFECNTTLLRNLGGWTMKHNDKWTFMILIKLRWHPFVQKMFTNRNLLLCK